MAQFDHNINFPETAAAKILNIKEACELTGYPFEDAYREYAELLAETVRDGTYRTMLQCLDEIVDRIYVRSLRSN